jgi:hypothetical protein
MKYLKYRKSIIGMMPSRKERILLERNTKLLMYCRKLIMGKMKNQKAKIRLKVDLKG